MTEKYRSNSQQRILKILVHLGGHEVNGLAPGEISNSLQISAANVTHDLQNLKYAGLVEQLPDSNRYRLTPRIPQIAVAMLNGISRAEGKLAETRNRFTKQPY
ncbi:MAG: IclR family transcriptional regulator [Candidatus Sedimenticola sp. (ex Thyasira tokunagai)]